MQQADTIQYLAHQSIDKQAWNNCIDKAPNGLIYAYSDYLDAMTDNWDALVLNDYEAVMPLPWRKKFGIRYLYQPAFLQQLGVFGKTKFNLEILRVYLFRSVKYGDVFFNYDNEYMKQCLNLVEKTNFIIDLSKGYQHIASNYKKDLVLNLKKTKNKNLNISFEDNIELAISAYQCHYKNRLGHIKSKDFENFKKLCLLLKRKNMCFTTKVTDKKNALLAIGLFLKDNKRIYNLMNTTTNSGRNKEANHVLLDAVIKEFSGEDLLFDFEGSDLPGVKNFYEKFGAVDQPYFHFHHNQLPGLLKIFKR